MTNIMDCNDTRYEQSLSLGRAGLEMFARCKLTGSSAVAAAAVRSLELARASACSAKAHKLMPGRPAESGLKLHLNLVPLNIVPPIEFLC